MTETTKDEDNAVPFDPEDENRLAKLETPVDQTPITFNTLAILMKGPTMPQRYKESATGVMDAYAAILQGREIGLGPMQSINDLYLVNGQISMTGKLMSALVHKAGHQIRMKLTNDKAVAEAWRRDPWSHELEMVGSVTFSKADSKLAGLDDKDTYKSYPRVMMGWRAVSQLCRIYFADCLAGVAYVPEEVGIEVPIEAIPEVIDVEIDDSAAAEQAAAIVTEVLDAEIVSETT